MECWHICRAHRPSSSMASLKIDLKAYLSGILHILFSHTPSSLTAELAMALVAPPTANVSTTNISFTSEYLDQDHSGGLLATSVLFIVIDISVVALRFVSRRLNKTPLGRDDFMSVPALFFCLTVCAMGIGKKIFMSMPHMLHDANSEYSDDQGCRCRTTQSCPGTFRPRKAHRLYENLARSRVPLRRSLYLCKAHNPGPVFEGLHSQTIPNLGIHHRLNSPRQLGSCLPALLPQVYTV